MRVSRRSDHFLSEGKWSLENEDQNPWYTKHVWSVVTRELARLQSINELRQRQTDRQKLRQTGRQTGGQPKQTRTSVQPKQTQTTLTEKDISITASTWSNQYLWKSGWVFFFFSFLFSRSILVCRDAQLFMDRRNGVPLITDECHRSQLISNKTASEGSYKGQTKPTETRQRGLLSAALCLVRVS